MDYSGPRRIMIITNKFWLLSTSISQLLEREDASQEIRVVENAEEAAKLLAAGKYSLVIFISFSPISIFHSNLAKVCQYPAKILLIISNNNYFMMRYISNFKLDGLLSIEAS